MGDGSDYFPSGLHDAMRLYARFNANIDRRLVDPAFSATQRRILLELLERPNLVDVELSAFLALDRSFLSRTLKGLITQALVSHKPGLRHLGQRHLFLTPEGTLEAERLRYEMGNAIVDEFMEIGGDEQLAILESARVQGPRGSGAPADDAITIRMSEAPDYSWFLSEMERTWYGLRKDEFVGQLASVIGNSIADRQNWGLRWTAVQAGIPVGICLITRYANGVDLGLMALYVTPSARQLRAGSEMLRIALASAALQASCCCGR